MKKVMKRIMAVMALMGCLSANAQEMPVDSVSSPVKSDYVKKSAAFLEFGTAIWTVSGANPSLFLQFGFTHNVNELFGFGAGVGVLENTSFSEPPIIPIFVRGDLHKRMGSLTPFLTFDVGYGINTNNFSAGAIIINPMVGVRYDGFSLGLGYYGLAPTQSGGSVANSFALRLGYNFGEGNKGGKAIAGFFRKMEFQLEGGGLFAMGGSHKASAYQEKTLVTSSGESWISQTHEETYLARTDAGGYVSMGFIWPVVKNFYAGISVGANIYRYYDKWTEINNYRNSPDAEFNRVERAPYSTDTRIDIPIAARFKYKVKELTFAKRFYPWAQLDLGGAVSTNEGGTYFYYAPAVGVSMDVAGGRHSLDLGLSVVPLGEKNFRGPGYETTISDETLGDLKSSKTAFRIGIAYTF